MPFFLRLAQLCLLISPGIALTAATYEVGPGQAYTSIGAVPWESLAAGDTVRIHHRSTPYREKWVISRNGTQASPITITGVLGSNGERPVIDGENATTRSTLNYWARNRGVIKVGGSSVPNHAQASWIVIENLDITSAREPYSFTAPNGATEAYADNAAAIYIESGTNITVRNCIIRNSGNGFFVAHGPSSNIVVQGCYIHGNGVEDSVYEHNVYTEARGIIFEYNRFGPLRSGCRGNNLKDRSAGTVVRYNWIEGGNRQLDLVESEDYADIRNDPAYRTTLVYGNVLIEPSGDGNRQMIHYGGDGGTESRYRQGTLHLYHNTIVSYRTDRTVLVRLSSTAERGDFRNNLMYTTAAGSTFYLLEEGGTLTLATNWLKTGWQQTVSGSATITATGNLTGSSPGFANEGGRDFRLATGSAGIGAAGSLAGAAQPDHVPVREYVVHQQTTSRPHIADVGAFAHGGGGGNQAPVVSAATATPATVPGATSALGATATDDGGEGALTYTWSGNPGTVTFSPNGTNGAKTSTATFTAAGSYVLTVTARDAGNLTGTRTVDVTVQQTATAVTVSSPTATVAASATTTLSAQVRDQFDAVISGGTITWSVLSGGGSVDAAGVYTAPGSAGTAVVQAAHGGHTATVTVTITAGGGNEAPVVSAATATSAPVTGATTGLSATATDDGGEAALTYTWSGSPTSVTFSPNGSNAAKTSTATFSAAGSYVLTVTARDAGNLTGTRTVAVTVQQTPTTMTVPSATATVAVNATVALAAQVRDQFNAVIAGAPITWSVQSGGGSVNGAGVYTAPGTAGTAVVRAANGPRSVTITVTTTGGGGSNDDDEGDSSSGESCGFGVGMLALLLGGMLFTRRHPGACVRT